MIATPEQLRSAVHSHDSASDSTCLHGGSALCDGEIRESAHDLVDVHDHLEDWTASARRIVGSDDLARDAVQEALRDFWLLDHLPPRPIGWLARAIVYRSLQIRRGVLRREKHEARAAACRATIDPADPSSLCARREDRDRLRGALRDLPQSHRTILEKRWMEGLDYVAIANELSVPVGTVRSRLNRARSLLRNALASTSSRSSLGLS